VQSFRSSGWQHKFYTDVESASFLDTHFPKEVREAYDTLLPGAFKADLFRYCVLLIYGGVYADVDIMLESFLDVSVGPDVGFMVPIDEVSLRLHASRLDTSNEC
jgi:mannosyltransferase OCH1-like enzyme